MEVPVTDLRQKFQQFVASQGLPLSSRSLQHALVRQCKTFADRIELLDFLVEAGADIRYIIPEVTGRQGSQTHVYAVQYCAEKFRMSQQQAALAVAS